MELDLTPEQSGFRDAVRDLAEDVVAPRAPGRDRAEGFPLDVVRRLGELGLFGLPFPERYGGLDADFLTFCLCVEELARVDPPVSIALGAAVGLGANAIFRFGTEAQKERWLVPMARGVAIGAFAATEPDGSSDALAIATTARLEGGEWVIDGTKASVMNADTPITSAYIVAARIGAEDIGAIVVPADASGLSVRPPRLGSGGGDVREVVLRACRAPEGNRLGRRDPGLRLSGILVDGRIAMAAVAVGLARGCLEQGLPEARDVTSRPPARALDGYGPGLVDAEAAVEAGRLAYVRAARLKDHGRPYASEAAMAGLGANEAALRCARHAVRAWGGPDELEGTPVARFYRAMKALGFG